MNQFSTPRSLQILPCMIFGLMIACLFPSLATGQKAEVPSKLQERAAEYKRPVVIVFKGPIDFKNTAFFKNRLAQAKKHKADLLILEIDSPGGYAIQSLEMAEALRDVDWAYTIAFVSREAMSGASLMSLGCDEIVIGSQARFGDSGAIQYDPSLAAFKYVSAKAKSALVRQAQDLAMSKERSPELAEALIDENAVVFVRKREQNETGPREYRSIYLKDEKDVATDLAKKAGMDLNKWELIEETKRERFLTVNGPRAIEIGIGNFVADERGEILKELNATGEVVEYKYNFTDGVVYWLNSPLVTGLLFLIGLIALYFELSAPGIGFGGLLAGLCAALFFWSRFAGGTSGWLEVILFAAGIIFLLMEIFVIPGFGVSGFTGLVLLFVSVVMASQDFVIPENSGQWNQLSTTLVVVLASTCVFAIGAAFISRKFGKIPLLNQISLKPPPSDTAVETLKDDSTGKPIPKIHPDVSVGDWGHAESLLRPAGRASINGNSMDVVSDGSYLEPGAQVRVVEISGNRIVVSEVEKNDETVWRGETKSGP